MPQILVNIPDTQYNNIMSISSVNLGRIPYKGIVMYAINGIKNGTVLPDNTTNGDMVLSLFPIPDVIREQANHKVLERFNFYKVDVDYHWWNKPYVQQDGKTAIHPIIHAKWHDFAETGQEELDSYWRFWCSNCHNQNWKESVFCPNCGAKMDKEDKHDL